MSCRHIHANYCGCLLIVLAVTCCTADRTLTDKNSADGKELHAKLLGLLADNHPGPGSYDTATDIIAELARLKYAPAKDVVYRTMFYWYGADETMITHTQLFEIKHNLSTGITNRVVAAASDLEDVDVTCMVFVNNSKELLLAPDTKPDYSVLIQVETHTDFGFDGADETKRKDIARKVGVPADNVGLKWGSRGEMPIENNIDQRLNTETPLLVIRIRDYLKSVGGADDMIVARSLSKAVCEQEIVMKIFAYCSQTGMSNYTDSLCHSLTSLVARGVLSEEDAATAEHRNRQIFGVRERSASSGRHELFIGSCDQQSPRGTSYTFDRTGRMVNSDSTCDRSMNLPADIKLMWSVDGDGRSPDEAIEAAWRVFNTVALKGNSRKDIVAAIGDYAQRTNGVYNAPFWPVEDDNLVYRFDNGNYGWQFNVVLDKNGICKGVRKRWIH